MTSEHRALLAVMCALVLGSFAAVAEEPDLSGVGLQIIFTIGLLLMVGAAWTLITRVAAIVAVVLLALSGLSVLIVLVTNDDTDRVLAIVSMVLIGVPMFCVLWLVDRVAAPRR